jgi:hypothetical protein
LKDFWAVFERAFRGRFQQGTGAGAVTSTPEVDEVDPNKSNAFGVVPVPLTLVRGTDVFPLWIPPLAAKVFSARLSPELPELNFFLGFRALASANSWAEV